MRSRIRREAVKTASEVALNLNQCQHVQPGMTQHLREVRKNIQNRWSAGSPPGALGEVGPEGQHLLSSSAQDTPPDCGAGSPVPAPRHGQHQHAAVAAFPPSNAQLQRVIADALLREQQQQQSKVLSTTTSATNLHQPRQTTSTSSYSVTAPPARQETIC